MHCASAAAARTATPAPLPRGTERVTDRDRERVAALLTDAAGDGLLSLAEVDDRLARTWSAATGADLAAATADLPEAWLRRRRQAEAAAAAARAAAATLPGHVRTYLLVVGICVAVWLLTGAGYPWPVWPALGMGIGVLGHARASRALRRSTRGPVTAP